jgi:CheY-like chemotaxis protein
MGWGGPGLAKPTKTILVVDDEDGIRELVVDALEQFGFSTLTARNGDEALRFLQGDALRIDLLLSDVMMPGTLDGIALARAARVLWPGLRIVLVSGYVAPELGSALASESFALLRKPFTAKRLLGAIGEEFRKHPLAEPAPEPEAPPAADAAPPAERLRALVAGKPSGAA